MQSPPGKYVATFREHIQAVAWAAANVPAGQAWVVEKWTIAAQLHQAGVGPPAAPHNLPPVQPHANPLPAQVHALPAQGAMPASP